MIARVLRSTSSVRKPGTVGRLFVPAPQVLLPWMKRNGHDNIKMVGRQHGVRMLSAAGKHGAEPVTRRTRSMPKHDFVLGHFYVAIVGRPNVGKSTIYNRLLRSKEAIVSRIPGTTRDRKEGRGQMGELEFTLCDTGGFENLGRRRRQRPTELLAPDHGTDLVDAMHLQTREGIRRADLIMLVVDGKTGILPDDEEFARWIRANMKPPAERLGNGNLSGVVLIANKTESMGHGYEWGYGDPKTSNFLNDCFRLGFGEPIFVSAEHGQGFGEIHNAMLPYAIASGEKMTESDEEFKAHEVAKDEFQSQLDDDADFDEAMMLAEDDDDEGSNKKAAALDDDARRTVHTCIVGRPNVGKSTLVNAIIGQERCITGPVPGLTRDAVAIDWEHEGRSLRLIDTAGIRRRTRLVGKETSVHRIQKSLRGMDAAMNGKKGASTSKLRKVEGSLEDIAIKDSIKAMERSQVVVVVVDVMAQHDDPDASGCLSKHDLAIIGRVLEEGRALIIAANKCDLGDPNWEKTHKKEVVDWVRHHIESSVPGSQGLPVIPMSAKTGQGIQELVPTIVGTYDTWRSRIPTAKLNRWLQDVTLRHSPPSLRGSTYRKRQNKSGRLRIKYMTQATTRPPTFLLFVNRAKPTSDVIPDDYINYLINNLRSDFNLYGVPLRFSVKGNMSSRPRK